MLSSYYKVRQLRNGDRGIAAIDVDWLENEILAHNDEGSRFRTSKRVIRERSKEMMQCNHSPASSNCKGSDLHPSCLASGAEATLVFMS